MNLDQYIVNHALRISCEQRPAVLAFLEEQTLLKRSRQGNGDTEFMKFFCLQLFGLGIPDDALPIWWAKTASMDADASLDIQLLCGAGVERTRSFLTATPEAIAKEALARLDRCIAEGDFDGFSPARYFTELEEYFCRLIADRKSGENSAAQCQATA